jgi:hypothetical protein
VNFQLGSSSGTIALYAPDRVTQVNSVAYGSQNNNISDGRFADGASSRQVMNVPTPGTSNRLPGFNAAPAIEKIQQQAATPGQELIVVANATDPDGASQALTFSIAPGSPAGASITSDGVFTWTPTLTQKPGGIRITIHVTDSGTPPRLGSETFTVTVRPGPHIRSSGYAHGQITFTFDTVPGRTYRAFYKDDVAGPTWSQLAQDFIAANSTASLTDRAGSETRFYRVLQVD